MTDISPRLALPYLLPNQSQKHVTVNEALRRLDGIVQLSVESSTLAVQPAAPGEGACYILPSEATGAAWATLAAGDIVHFVDGAWQRIAPKEGWLAFDQAADRLLVFDGAAWVSLFEGAGFDDRYVRTDGTGLGVNADLSIQGTASGYPALSFRRTDDAGRCFAFGLDAGSRRLFINRWNPASGAYVENMLFIGNDGVVDFVGAEPPRHAGNYLYHAGGSLIPSADNAHSLGSATRRFADVFVASGVISTSDARDKSAFVPLRPSLRRAGERLCGEIGLFRWQAAIAAKGDGARWHVGLSAQRVAEVLQQEGEDAGRLGLLCAAGEDANGPLSLRMDQVLLLMMAALAQSPGRA